MAVFTNYATLSYKGGTLNSNTVTGEILETIAVEKTAVSGSYSSGDTLSYALSLVNSGSADALNLAVTDDLGAYELDGVTLYPLSYVDGTMRLFINGVLQPSATVLAGPPLAVSGISIPADGSAVLVYEAAVTEYAPLAAGSEITNTASVTGGGIVTPVTASETVPVLDTAVLSISKALSPALVKSSSDVSYSFEISNSGNSAVTGADDAILSDDFNPILTNLSVSFNGAVWTQGVNYSYNEVTGVFSTLPGQLTVPAASYTQNPDGSWTVQPGISILTVSGTINA